MNIRIAKKIVTCKSSLCLNSRKVLEAKLLLVELGYGRFLDYPSKSFDFELFNKCRLVKL